MSAQTVSTSTNNLATSYAPSQLTAVAANGDTFVVWFDGTNIKYSYAASPYTSWTNTTLHASIGGGPRWQAGLYHNRANDNVVVVAGNSAGNMLAYVFTYSSGSHSWTPGSANTVLASSGSFNGGAVPMAVDAQGRIWVAWANNSNVIQVRYSTDGGVTWTASTTATQVGGGANGVIGLASIGNYIVLTYVDSTITYVYQRIDAHSASLGSWSAKADTGSGVDNGANAVCLRGAPGSNYGVLVNDEGTSIPSRIYNASTDTWSSTTTLGASASDRDPTLATDGTDLYAVWCSFAASNSYALVYKKFTASTQTWDTSATTLEASGTNILWPQADASSGTLSYVWTVGTASPWTVKQDTASIGGGGGTPVAITGQADGVGAATLTPTVSHLLSGTAAGTGTASLSLTVSHPLSMQADGVGTASLSVTVSHSLTGTANGTGGATLSLTVSHVLSGQSDGVGGASLTLTVSHALTGEADGVGTATLALAGTGVQVAGTANGTGAASLSLTVTHLVTGTAAGVGASTLALTVARGITGQADGTGTATLALLVTRLVVGQADGVGAVTLTLSVGVIAPGRVRLTDALVHVVTIADAPVAVVTLADRAVHAVSIADSPAEGR